MLHTTSRNASSFYCCRLHVPSKPTTCSHPKGKQLQCGQTEEVGAVFFLRNAQAVNFFHVNLVVGLLQPLQSPFTELSLFPAFLFEAFSIAQLLCTVRTARYVGIAICIRTSSDLLPRKEIIVATGLVFLLVFPCAASANIILAHALFETEILPHSAQKLPSFPQSPSIPSTSETACPAEQVFHCNTAGTN